MTNIPSAANSPFTAKAPPKKITTAAVEPTKKAEKSAADTPKVAAKAVADAKLESTAGDVVKLAELKPDILVANGNLKISNPDEKKAQVAEPVKAGADAPAVEGQDGKPANPEQDGAPAPTGGTAPAAGAGAPPGAPRGVGTDETPTPGSDPARTNPEYNLPGDGAIKDDAFNELYKMMGLDPVKDKMSKEDLEKRFLNQWVQRRGDEYVKGPDGRYVLVNGKDAAKSALEEAIRKGASEKTPEGWPPPSGLPREFEEYLNNYIKNMVPEIVDAAQTLHENFDIFKSYDVAGVYKKNAKVGMQEVRDLMAEHGEKGVLTKEDLVGAMTFTEKELAGIANRTPALSNLKEDQDANFKSPVSPADRLYDRNGNIVDIQMPIPEGMSKFDWLQTPEAKAFGEAHNIDIDAIISDIKNYTRGEQVLINSWPDILKELGKDPASDPKLSFDELRKGLGFVDRDPTANKNPNETYTFVTPGNQHLFQRPDEVNNKPPLNKGDFDSLLKKIGGDSGRVTHEQVEAWIKANPDMDETTRLAADALLRNFWVAGINDVEGRYKATSGAGMDTEAKRHDANVSGITVGPAELARLFGEDGNLSAEQAKDQVTFSGEEMKAALGAALGGTAEAGSSISLAKINKALDDIFKASIPVGATAVSRYDVASAEEKAKLAEQAKILFTLRDQWALLGLEQNLGSTGTVSVEEMFRRMGSSAGAALQDGVGFNYGGATEHLFPGQTPIQRQAPLVPPTP